MLSGWLRSIHELPTRAVEIFDRGGQRAVVAATGAGEAAVVTQIARLAGSEIAALDRINARGLLSINI